MRKILLCLAFLLYFTVIPQTTDAFYVGDQQGSNDYKDYKFAINAFNEEPNPPDYIKDTSKININIQAFDSAGNQQAIFTTGKSYYIFFEQPDTKFGCTRFRDLSRNPATTYIRSNSTPNQLEFTIEPKIFANELGISCNLTPGTYKIKIWSEDSREPYKPWLENFTFAIQSPAGGSPAKLVAAASGENLICKDRQSEARIENAEEGKTFSVYWEHSMGPYAWSDKAPSRNFPILLDGNDLVFTPGNMYRLCLVEGATIRTAAAQLGCPSALVFDYSADEKKCANNTKLSCMADVKPLLNGTAKKQAAIKGSNFPGNISNYRGDLIDTKNKAAEPKRFPDIKMTGNGSVSVDTGELAPGTYSFNFYPQTGDDATDRTLTCPVAEFTIDNKVESGNEKMPPVIDFKPLVCGSDGNRCANSSGQFCNTSTGQQADDGNGVLTAIGCVPKDPAQLIAGLMKYITGFSGGIALLLMVFGSFQMMTSAGNAETLKKGREQFVSAVIGLLFVIFSVLLLQIIGVDLLGLPGFKK